MTMPLQAADVAVVNSEAVGFSSNRLGKISEFADREIAAGNLAGAVTLVARNGQVVLFESAGRYGLEDDRPMDKDALFRIFSMTKPITTVAAMILYEEGAFHLGDPVAKYLPELKDMQLLIDGSPVNPQRQMTIEQLMTHTAGLTNGWHLEHPVERAYRDAALYQSADLDAFIDKLATLPLRFEPGTRYHYSVATDVLGALVERLSGQTLEQFFQARIFDPLDMRDTFFNVPDNKLTRVAGSHLWNAEGQLLELTPAEAFAPIRCIGGATGWYAHDWLWRVRGFLDLLVGGVGVRRGRPDPAHLRVGDTIDWWRVEAYESDRVLRLRAEMKVPGHAWLEWKVVDEGDGRTMLRQRARFHPRGLAGRAYWWVLLPIHKVIWTRMARRLAAAAASGPRASSQTA